MLLMSLFAELTMGNESGALAVCGNTWKLKTFPRVLFCIILFNVVIAAMYFSSVFSFLAFPSVRQDYIVQGSKKIELSANLMGHKIGKERGSPKFELNGLRDSGRDDEFQSNDGETAKESMIDPGIIIEPEDAKGLLAILSNKNIKSVEEHDSHKQSNERPRFVANNNVQSSLLKLPPSPVSGINSPELSNEYGRQRLKKLDEKTDANHPQFSLAFPRHIKPYHLLNWTRPLHSDRYFQPIEDESAWVYSAFYDVREEIVQVRVFGIALRHRTGLMFCHFLDPRGNDLKHQRGHMKLMKDSHGANFSAVEILCPVKENLHPDSVRVTFLEDSSMQTNQLKILYPSHHIRNFTVCFPPLHSNYSQLTQIVQIIEFNRVVGADHFFIYNFSMSTQVSALLQQYQSEGIVTVLPWPLPVMETWYYGQVLAINDCVYRNMGISKFVVVTDTDEVIVPHIHLSWMTLLENVVTHPWQRDDEFKDPDLSLGSPYLRTVTFKNDKSEEQEQETEETDDKSNESKILQESNFVKHSLDSEEGRHISHVSSKRKKPFVRSNDKFPSKSVGNPSSRNLLAYKPDFRDENLSKDEELRFGSFSFRCAFFSAKRPEKQHMKELQRFVFSQQENYLYGRMPKCPMTNVVRIDTLFEHGERSKLIVRPELVVSTGIHKVISHIQGYRTAYVEPEIALLHHYRRYKLSDCNTLDTSALNFKENFYENLNSVVNKFPSWFLSQNVNPV